MTDETMVRPGEHIVKTFGIGPRLFWFIVIAGIILAIFVPIGLSFGAGLLGFPVTPSFTGIVTVIGFLLGGLLAAYAVYFRASRHYTLTDQRVIATLGVFSKHTVSVEFADVTDMSVTQDFFERFVLGTGMVALNTAGADVEELQLERVENPYAIGTKIRELAEQRLQELGQDGGPPTMRTKHAGRSHQ